MNSPPVRRVAAFAVFGTIALIAASLSVDPGAVRRLMGRGSDAPPSEALFDAAWSRDPIWDDGLAEISTYDAQRVIDGAACRYTATVIVMKEELDARFLATAGAARQGGRTVPALKLSAVEEIPAPDRDYRLLTSTFVLRDDPCRLVKATSGSQEWGGNAFKAIVVRNGHAQMTYFSYLDGERDGTIQFELRPGDFTTEQLALALRGLRFQPGLTLNARLLPAIAGNRAPDPRLTPARIVVDRRETIAAAGGLFDTWRVFVERDGGETDVLWFDAAEPGGLVRWHGADRHQLNLVSRERRASWQSADWGEKEIGEAVAPPIASPLSGLRP